MHPPKVLLPSDLPSWRCVQESILALQDVQSTDHMVAVMIRIHNLSRISIEIQGGEEEERNAAFARSVNCFKDIVDNQFSDHERERFLSRTLTCIAKFAISLQELQPRQGLKFCLENTTTLQKLDRRFVASLVANAFLSTFPFRSASLRPHLGDVSFQALFGDLSHSMHQAQRLKNMLNYFDILDVEEAVGHVTFARSFSKQQGPNGTGEEGRGSSSFQKRFQGDAENSHKPLSPIFVLQDQRRIDLHSNSSNVILRQLPKLDLQPETLADNLSEFVQHPEVLISLFFTESLSPNECLKISGMLNKTPSRVGCQSSNSIDNSLEAICLLDQKEVLHHSDEHHAFLELEHYINCLIPHEENSSPLGGENKSSTLSDKSSLLDRLADNLSMMVESANKSGTEMSLPTEESSSSPSSSSDDEESDCSGWKTRRRRRRLGTKKKKSTSSVSPKKKRKDAKKRDCFSERLKAALERGNTPDSENCSKGGNSRSQTRFEVEEKTAAAESVPEAAVVRMAPKKRSGAGSDGFQLEDEAGKEAAVLPKNVNKRLRPPLEKQASSQYSFSGDSSYSFELNGVNDMDVDFEDMLSHLTANESGREEEQDEEEEDERTKILKNFTDAILKRSMSESLTPIIMNLERTAIGDNITLNKMRPPPKLALPRRSRSFDLDDSILLREREAPETPPPRHESFESDSNKTYVWVVNPPSILHPVRFLFQWLAVSLSDIPLLVYQSHDDNLDDIFHICGQIEQKGWNTQQVAQTISNFFKATPSEEHAENPFAIINYFEHELMET